MKVLTISLSLALCSCGSMYLTKREIPEEKRAEAAKFIIDVCRESNPKSDEEPEDMIEEARSTAEKLYGVDVLYINNGKGSQQL